MYPKSTRRKTSKNINTPFVTMYAQKKYNYERHIQTDKHKQIQTNVQKEQKEQKEQKK
jgi:hypothetical protein